MLDTAQSSHIFRCTIIAKLAMVQRMDIMRKKVFIDCFLKYCGLKVMTTNLQFNFGAPGMSGPK